MPWHRYLGSFGLKQISKGVSCRDNTGVLPKSQPGINHYAGEKNL
jgi:hypothetical protein